MPLRGALPVSRLAHDASVYVAGRVELLSRPCVAIVGARKASADGLRRAARLARELANNGIVVVSGLAAGIDGAAHRACIEAGGDTIAVLGTPLNHATPAAHASLQLEIATHHLAISPFAPDSVVRPSNFPQRNKIMAMISDATVIIEASDTSGTLHQATECQRLHRWLFVARSVAEDPALNWPKSFLRHERARVLSSVENVLSVLT